MSGISVAPAAGLPQRKRMLTELSSAQQMSSLSQPEGATAMGTAGLLTMVTSIGPDSSSLSTKGHFCQEASQCHDRAMVHKGQIGDNKKGAP